MLAYAQQTRQVIVTSNHDMMMICAEMAQRFIWLDPRGRKYGRAEQVLVVFSQIDRWQGLLNADDGLCVRALRTKCVAMDPGEAARLAEQRMRELRRRRRHRKAAPVGPLVTDNS